MLPLVLNYIIVTVSRNDCTEDFRKENMSNKLEANLIKNSMRNNEFLKAG